MSGIRPKILREMFTVDDAYDDTASWAFLETMKSDQRWDMSYLQVGLRVTLSLY